LDPAPSCQRGVERLADSGIAAARVLQSCGLYCTCPSSCVSALNLPPSVQHTLPDVGAKASAAFCSTQHAALQLYARAQGKHFFASSTHVPRDVSRDSGATPLVLWGKPFLVVLQGTSQWCHTPLSHPLLPDKIEGISVVRSSSPIQPSVRDRASWDTFPRKKEEGSFVKLGQEPSTGFCSNSNASTHAWHTTRLRVRATLQVVASSAVPLLHPGKRGQDFPPD
jgi:hypothetical protein